MDTLRQQGVFDPSKVQGSVLVVGAGALGSAVALSLAKLSVSKICVIDFDSIESWNIPNQYLYGPADIGRCKVTALAERISMLTGNEIFPIVGEVGDGKVYDKYVFLCVDSMKARKKIFNDCIFMNGNTTFVADGRMGARNCAAYTFRPNDLKQVEAYRKELYDDEDVKPDVGNCSNVLSIGATAQALAACLTWQFITEVQTGKRDDDEILFTTDPWRVLSSRKFQHSHY